jgi:hypothetical protein
MYNDETKRNMLAIALIVIILGTAIGRSIAAVTHHAAFGFVAVVAVELPGFSLMFLWLQHQRS